MNRYTYGRSQCSREALLRCRGCRDQHTSYVHVPRIHSHGRQRNPAGTAVTARSRFQSFRRGSLCKGVAAHGLPGSWQKGDSGTVASISCCHGSSHIRDWSRNAKYLSLSPGCRHDNLSMSRLRHRDRNLPESRPLWNGNHHTPSLLKCGHRVFHPRCFHHDNLNRRQV